MNCKRFIIECIIVGIVLMAVGLPISYIGMKLSKEKKLPPLKSWIAIAISLFITGIITHIIFEVSGLNKKYIDYYCNNTN